MPEGKIYEVPSAIAKRAHIDHAKYEQMYKRSVDDPEGFWAEQAETFLDWFESWDKVLDWDFEKGHIRWFEGGKLNATHNCLDRHLDTRGDQAAIIWESDDPKDSQTLTYRELHQQVCKFANVLRDCEVKKGDRVCIYMPMIPQVAVAMLACARIGAIHSVVFGGFSPEALKDRIQDSDCRIVITADEGVRGGKKIPLKKNTDKALKACPNVHTVIVVKRTGGDIEWTEGRDRWYQELMNDASTDCAAEKMDAEDPLFILYTSGSTGSPKGVLHTTGGYLLYAAATHKYVFDYHDGDVYWCTADVGWVTGHSYILYGPLANGATTLMFEGLPTYPDASRHWQVVDKHKVNIYYTAPTAIRALLGQGDDFVKQSSRKSLRILGTVGEPINPESWEWFHRVVGEGRCPIVDTWWQTETGGIMITPLPGATALKPGSAAKPFFGVVPALMDDQGKALEGPATGSLVIKQPWPGQMRTVYGDHQRFVDTYFKLYPGVYTSGDGARRDEDGYYWITGRVDDVINVSGHRMGTAEIESALVQHESVAEAAVVGFPHETKGQGIYCYVTLKQGKEGSEELRKELVQMVRDEIGAIAKPDVIHWTPSLPKTRSGKIMRRILRKVAANELEDLGDTSTLADPSVVDDLIENRANK
ncbi:MAG TPA: acetate--CoA ligase [Gammaproteobacteria bacterium]|nr:acetate--CoA ligase [Gammaproteobacteria bacterium]